MGKLTFLKESVAQTGKEERKRKFLAFASHGSFSEWPWLMETQMWRRSSCWLLSGVIKKGLGHTERPRETRWHCSEKSATLHRALRSRQTAPFNLLQRETFNGISLIVEASLRPSASVGGTRWSLQCTSGSMDARTCAQSGLVMKCWASSDASTAKWCSVKNQPGVSNEAAEPLAIMWTHEQHRPIVRVRVTRLPNWQFNEVLYLPRVC